MAIPSRAARELLDASMRGVTGIDWHGRADDSPVRLLMAQAGTGLALLALAGQLDELAEERAGDRLAREAAVVQMEIGRADAKCGVLVAVTGAAAAWAASQAHGHLLAQAAAALFVAATVLALTALRPRIGRARWRRWATGAEDPADRLADKAEVVDLSAIAVVKYRLIRAAVDLAAVGLAVIVIGMVIA